MRLLIVVLVLAALLAPRTGFACWDGHTAESARVSLCVMDGATEWQPATARELADWLVRVEALLPPGYRADACAQTISVCRTMPSGAADDDCLGDDTWSPQRLSLLFRCHRT